MLLGNKNMELKFGSFSPRHPVPRPTIQPGENTHVFKIILSNFVEPYLGES